MKETGPAMLCRLDDIPEGTARAFLQYVGVDLVRIFVVRRGGAVRAYANACPHMGTPLGGGRDPTVTQDGAHLICAAHGALFRIEDGTCVAGPCAGKALTPVRCEVAEGEVRIVWPGQ